MKTSKIVYIVLSLVVLTFSVSACKQSSDTSKKIEIKQDEEDNIDIDKNNAEAINIEKIKFGETAYVDLEHKEFANIIEITSYGYIAEGKRVSVNVRDSKIDIKKSKIVTENSKSYETLVLSDFKKLNDADEGNTYSLKIKNSSSKDLGNLILKVAEINENGDYINLEHIAYNSVLKASEEAEIDVISSKETTKLEVVGYIYNDADQNLNVDIDFKSHKAIID